MHHHFDTAARDHEALARYNPKQRTPIEPLNLFALCGDEGGPLIVGIDETLPYLTRDYWRSESERLARA